MSSFGDNMSQLILVDKDDLHKIITQTNRIDLILDKYKGKIPMGPWLEMNDLNIERSALFEKYCKQWDELD